MIHADITPEQRAILNRKSADSIQVGGEHYNNAESPNHYTIGGIETIEYIRAKLNYEQLKGYYLGNLLKYLSRAEHKNGKEDYLKAEVYLKWLIELESPET